MPSMNSSFLSRRDRTDSYNSTSSNSSSSATLQGKHRSLSDSCSSFSHMSSPGEEFFAEQVYIDIFHFSLLLFRSLGLFVLVTLIFGGLLGKDTEGNGSKALQVQPDENRRYCSETLLPTYWLACHDCCVSFRLMANLKQQRTTTEKLTSSMKESKITLNVGG